MTPSARELLDRIFVGIAATNCKVTDREGMAAMKQLATIIEEARALAKINRDGGGSREMALRLLARIDGSS